MSVYSKVYLNHDHGEGTITQYIPAKGTMPAAFEVDWEDGCSGEYEEDELVALDAAYEPENWDDWVAGCDKLPVVDDWEAERDDVLDRFVDELAKATGDGSKKRQSGGKPPWYEDTSHEAAVFSHIMKWKKGELVDDSSGGHPLVHASWRLLAIACQETGNIPRG